MISTAIVDKLSALARQGVAMSVSPSGTLQVRPASRLTYTEQEWLRSHAGAILAHLAATVPGTPNTLLSGAEPWDARTAIRLMYDADTLVEQLGVDGRLPTVADAAAMVVSAFLTRDLETVRFAVSEFTALVHGLACERVPAARAGQTRASPGG